MFQNNCSVHALLINKKKGTSPVTGKHIFKLVFQTKYGILSFIVDEERYDCVDVGYQGQLQYQEQTIMAFGNWIDETLYPVYSAPMLSWLRS